MTCFAWSATGWSMRLLTAGDAERGGVVVRAEVQPGAAAGGGVHHRRDAGGAVGEQDRLRGLHLDLEAQPPLVQPVRRLEPAADVDERLDLVDRGDLGQRDHPAGREVAGGQHLAEHEVERCAARDAGSQPSSDLNRIPTKGGQVPAATAAPSARPAARASASSSSSDRVP